jgi:hypothetical protein
MIHGYQHPVQARIDGLFVVIVCAHVSSTLPAGPHGYYLNRRRPIPVMDIMTHAD